MIKTKIINVTKIIILNNGVRLDNASTYLKRNLVTRLFYVLNPMRYSQNPIGFVAA